MRTEVADAVIEGEEFLLEEVLQGGLEKLVARTFVGHIYGAHAVTEGEVARGFLFVADGQDGVLPAIGRNDAGGATGEAVHDDGAQVHHLGGLHSLFGKKFGDGGVFGQGNVDFTPISMDVLLSLESNVGHHLHRLNGIVAIGRFAREHEGIGVGIDSVGDVGHFGARGTRVLDHALEHLCGHDDRLMGADALLNDVALNTGNELIIHLDAQITTGHHNAIGGLDDFINVVHTLLVLNLGDDADSAVAGVEDGTDVIDIFFGTHETMGYEVNAVVDGKAQIGAVFLGERREIDAHSRHVHALARTQCTVIFNGADEFVFLFSVNDETQFAIVDEHMSAHLEVFHEVHVVHRDTFGRGELLRITHDAHGLSLLELDGCFAGRGAHFGTFGVDEDTDVGADGAHVFNDTTHTFGGLVGGVETHHVHTGIIEFLEQFDVATHIRNGGDNFGLFVHYLVFVF